MNQTIFKTSKHINFSHTCLLVQKIYYNSPISDKHYKLNENINRNIKTKMSVLLKSENIVVKNKWIISTIVLLCHFFISHTNNQL